MDLESEIHHAANTEDPIEDLDAEIEALLEGVDADDLKNMSSDEMKQIRDRLLALKTKISPYGRTVEGKSRLLCASILNVRDDYQIRFHLTAIIGYLNRALDEWRVPDNVPAVPVYDFFKDPSVLNPPEMANGAQLDPAIAAAYAESREYMKIRLAIKQFLEDTLLFNPDEHVRSAYQPNPNDPERKPIGTAAGQLAVYHRRAELQRLKKKDLVAIKTADQMVEYVDRVLYVVEDDAYRAKLVKLKEERLEALEKLRAEMDRRMKETKVIDTKIIAGKTAMDGTKTKSKSIRTEREPTEEEKEHRFKVIQEMCVLLGKLTGDINDITDRIERIDEWWEARKKREAAAAAVSSTSTTQTPTVDGESKENPDTVTIDGVTIPKQPEEVMAKIIEYQRKFKQATVVQSTDEVKVMESASQPPPPQPQPQSQPEVVSAKVIVPTAHVLPPTIEQQEVSAASIVNGPRMLDTGNDDRAALTTREFIPGVNIFNGLERYITQNFEALRSAVCDLYAMKPDIEFSINPYELFDNPDPDKRQQDATDFVDKHKNDVIASIVTLTTNVWNIMGPFKKNRERIHFYNEHTAVLEAMANESKRGAELGRDMMNKKRLKKRRQNRAEMGATAGDAKFEEWQKQNAPQSKTEEDQEDPDMPPDSIAVPIITIGKGGRTFSKKVIYTAAEPPTHMLGAPDQVKTKSDTL